MGEGMGGGEQTERSILLPLIPSRQGRGDFCGELSSNCQKKTFRLEDVTI